MHFSRVIPFVSEEHVNIANKTVVELVQGCLQPETGSTNSLISEIVIESLFELVVPCNLLATSATNGGGGGGGGARQGPERRDGARRRRPNGGQRGVDHRQESARQGQRHRPAQELARRQEPRRLAGTHTTVHRMLFDLAR